MSHVFFYTSRCSRSVYGRLSLLLVFLNMLSACVQADLIWLKDGRLGCGLLVFQNDQRIEFRVESFLETEGIASKGEQDRDVLSVGKLVTFEMPDVVDLRVNRDEQRLSKLDPRRPREYLRYADELALEKLDPTAARLAKRLYLIAVAIGDDGEQQGALLGLAALESDSKRKEAIGFFLALKTGYRMKSDSTKTINATVGQRKIGDWTTAEAKYMTQLIKAIRREQSQEAINLLKLAKEQESEDAASELKSNGQPGLQDSLSDRAAIARSAIGRWSSEWTLDQWNELARSKKMTDFQLRKLLTMEIEMMELMDRIKRLRDKTKSAAVINRIGRANKTWAEQALQPSAKSIVLPTINQLIDPEIGAFNLKATRYRKVLGSNDFASAL